MADRITLKPKQNKVRLFLDSGAYGAWSRGLSIDVKEYISYCKDNHELIHKLVNLDVIPGSFGRRDNTQAEVEKSAKLSYANQQTIKAAGLAPIPVFHQGERLHWLELMLRDGEPYVGLSPSKFVRVDEQMKWLDSVFNIICDKDGRPYVETHGFAATSFKLITSYPWRSVDSTTWSLTPGYGQIIIPGYNHGKFDYTHATRVIMSGVPQKNKNSQEKQYEALGDGIRHAVEKYITDVVGSTITHQRYSSIERCRAMLTYYVQLNKQLFDVRHKPTGSIFGPGHFDATILKPRKPWHLIQYFATEALHKEWAKIMNETNANDRLLSYWYLKERPNTVLEQFVRNGHCGEYERSPVKPDWRNETYRNRRKLALFLRVKEEAERDDPAHSH